MKTLEENSNETVGLENQETAGNLLQLTQYLGMTNASDSGPNNPYNIGSNSGSNLYKRLLSPGSSFFFDDVDHFRLHFHSNLSTYADPEIEEKDKNRKDFFGFSAYMLYSAVVSDEQENDEKKKPLEAVLSVFKRREIVKFDAKRKRFLNKMIKMNDPWSAESTSELLQQFDWVKAFEAFKQLKKEHKESGTANNYSTAKQFFAGNTPEDTDAIYYSKDEYKGEREWYYLGLRNQMTRKDQFVREQQLYNEFCLYVSLKQKLYKNTNHTGSLNALNENAQQFIDKMYGDGLNENYWGQAKYFRLLNKYFPDYSEYLTEQRDIIKEGLNSVMDDLLGAIKELLDLLVEFLKGVDGSNEKLLLLSSQIPEVKSKIASTRLYTLETLSEYGPEHKKSFELGLDALASAITLLESTVMEKHGSLLAQEKQKKEGIVALSALIELINGEKQLLAGSYLITDVEPFMLRIAKLQLNFNAQAKSLKKNLDIHNEIDQFTKDQQQLLDATKKETVHYDVKAADIQKDEVSRRHREITGLKETFKKVGADGMVESEASYYLSYNGAPQKEYNSSYWDSLVEKSEKEESDIQVPIYAYGKIGISTSVVNSFVDFLFGLSTMEEFEKKFKKYTGDNNKISSIYALIAHIEQTGMAGLSEKFSGDTRKIYETQTPEYYLNVIKARNYILSKKPEISKKFQIWQQSEKRHINNRNYQNVEYAKEKRRGQLISKWFSSYKSGTIGSDVFAVKLIPYLSLNEFDIRTGIAGLPVKKQGGIILSILENMGCEDEKLSQVHGGLLLFFYERLQVSEGNAPQVRQLRDYLKNSGWISDSDAMDQLRMKAMDRAMDFIEANPDESGNLYGFAGYHKGVPGKPIDCSGMVSQCVQYVGSDYLNSSPNIYGKQVYWLNGVGNIINQPNVWRILPEEVRVGDLVTMSDRKTYHDIDTGHIAFIYGIERDARGNITKLVLRHSSGSKGPNVQAVDLTDRNDYYARLVPSFKYWRYGDPKYQIPEELPQNAKFKMGEYSLKSYTDKSMPATVDFAKGKKYVEQLNEKRKENLGLIVNGLRKGGITNNIDIAAILAIVSKESNLIPKSENMNYSKERLPEVWGEFSKTGKKVAKGKGKDNYNQKAEELAGKPKELANFVYGGKFENTEPDDGWNYRGRGFNGITFKHGYIEASQVVGQDLVAEPDLVNQPDIAAELLANYMVDKMKTLKSQGHLEEYNSKGIGDFKHIRDAVYAYYHCNAGPYYSVDVIKPKAEEKESGMARAQARAPYFLQLLNQLTVVEDEQPTTVEIPEILPDLVNYAPSVQDGYLAAITAKTEDFGRLLQESNKFKFDFNPFKDTATTPQLTYNNLSLDVDKYWVSQGKTFNCDLFAKKVIDGQKKDFPDLYKDIGTINEVKTKRQNSLHIMWEKDYKKGTGRKQGKRNANDMSTMSPDLHERGMAIQYIHACLDHGIPAQVGVNHTYAYAKASGNQDKTTDHWIIIDGKGKDKKGNYFTYIDPGRSKKKDATDSENNRLYQDKNDEWIWKDDYAYKSGNNGVTNYVLVAVTLYEQHRNKNKFSLGDYQFDRKGKLKED